jgi:hypothetical protein
MASMRPSQDPLLVRAAAVLEAARDVRTQTQVVMDTARLQRLQRELVAKIFQIERIVSREVR